MKIQGDDIHKPENKPWAPACPEGCYAEPTSFLRFNREQGALEQLWKIGATRRHNTWGDAFEYRFVADYYEWHLIPMVDK